MSNMQQHLIEQLKTALDPNHLEVINESHNHSGSARESHFKLIIVSDYFNDFKLIERHRFINRLLKEEMGHIHALAMHTYTIDEWRMKNSIPDSPKCVGGSKF
ncbi:transcriptional regulator, BolA protein family [Candidatus Ruthia magnifica str. Cm (Calyptogena magnifica)]|uniref:Transcriptional regulator, BolA protein family n=1 Tax=Ruthia magnifica subsp. Calyptogena magnifica TaxID=413404 RepID=A1AX33_RUTMC|nr:BolA family protein [Candidatus Ruthturnera calyptogenae]ABL02490.1 transcriptional regulator, BolA protein family [Candidatus Ruthia magnifica str. Cm (Calyptogena magnifica)]